MKKFVRLLTALCIAYGPSLQADWAQEPTRLAATLLTGLEAAPVVAIDTTGNAVAVWKALSGANYILKTATLDADSAAWDWTTISGLSITSDFDNLQVAFANGRVVAVWRNIATDTLEGATLSYGNSVTWTPTAAITTDPYLTEGPVLASDSLGNTHLIWAGYDPTSGSEEGYGFAAYLPIGVSVWDIQKLNSLFYTDLSFLGIDLAVGGDNRAVAVFAYTQGTTSEVLGFQYDTSLPTWTWVPTNSLAYTTSVADAFTNPQVALNPITGQAWAIWADASASPNNIVVATLNSDLLSWTMLPDLTEGAATVGYPQIGVDATNNAIVLWLEASGAFWDTLQGALYSATTSAWILTDPVATSTTGLSSPHLSVNSLGNAVALWLDSDYLYAGALPIGSTTWLPISNLDTSSQDSRIPLALGESNRAVAGWLRTLSSYNEIRASFTTDLFLPVKPEPPSNFEGEAILKGVAHYLTWDPSPNPLVTGYKIYDGLTLLATVSALGPLEAIIFERDLYTSYTYTLVAYTAGAESDPVLLKMASYYPPAPECFQGKIYRSSFSTEKEIAHLLCWEPSEDTSVMGYKIYEGDKMLFDIPADRPSQVTIGNRKEKRVYTYALVAYNPHGDSKPATLTLP